MLKILIADDHEIVRRGLKEILRETYKDVEFGEVASATEVMSQIENQEWNLVLLDIHMPGKSVVDVLSEIRSISGVPVLILTASPEHSYATKTLKAGASGYITKRYATDELIDAVKCVLKGETYLSKEAVQGLTTTLRSNDAELPHQKLSPRELEILLLIASGKSVKNIAGDLHLSEKTVGTHLSRIKEKTRFSSYVEMTRYAIQHKLIE